MNIFAIFHFLEKAVVFIIFVASSTGAKSGFGAWQSSRALGGGLPESLGASQHRF